MKVLIVEDDRDLVELLEFMLTRAGFSVDTARDAPAATILFAAFQPDLVILDISIGASNGLEWLQQLRQQSQTPVILLTGDGSEDTKVLGLELGADDYVTKPFSYRELTARIRAVLRRQSTINAAAPMPAELVVGPLTLNPAEHTVYNNGQLVALTLTEFRLLQYLMTHAGSVVPTRTLLKQVWGYADGNYPDIVRVNLHRLRRKLGDVAQESRLLHTVPGVGILLKPGHVSYRVENGEAGSSSASIAGVECGR
jgi:DNA-binding response OmpR family regulator